MAHAGINDVKKHVSTAEHQHCLREVSSQHDLATLFRSEVVDQKTRADLLFANFIA